jgi:hypothetical protein
MSVWRKAFLSARQQNDFDAEYDPVTGKRKYSSTDLDFDTGNDNNPVEAQQVDMDEFYVPDDHGAFKQPAALAKFIKLQNDNDNDNDNHNHNDDDNHNDNDNDSDNDNLNDNDNDNGNEKGKTAEDPSSEKSREVGVFKKDVFRLMPFSRRARRRRCRYGVTLAFQM